MSVAKRFRGFAGDEGGAVTVDMVALMAALVLIGIGVATIINTSAKGYADKISTEVDSQSVWTF